jgi:hypothetical protein
MIAASIVSGKTSADIPGSGTEDAGHVYIRSNPIGIATKSRFARKKSSMRIVFRRLLGHGDTVAAVF